MSPIEGARPSAGSSIASAWLYPPALHTPQVPTQGRFVLLPPGPRLTPLPPVDDVAWLRGVGVCVCGGGVPRPECNSHLGPKRMLQGFVPGRVCKPFPRLARTVPSSALALRHRPWQRRTGALHPSPLAFEADSNPGRKAWGKWEERPE